MASRKGEFGEPVVLDVDGFPRHQVSSPQRVYFAARGETSFDLVNYYLSVGDGIVNALRERPCMLHRFPDGVSGPKVHQKRLPRVRRPGSRRCGCTSPATACTPTSCASPWRLADVAWAVQMSTVEFHPWNSLVGPTPRSPTSGASTSTRCRTRPRECAGRRTWPTRCADELGAVGWPKTSGGHGLHVYVRIAPDHGFGDVRRAALAFARAVECRIPDDVTTTWWRKDRDPEAVFVDYNQNARDHTIAAAYSVRGNDIGTVSTPFGWTSSTTSSQRLHHRDGAAAVRRAR